MNRIEETEWVHHTKGLSLRTCMSLKEERSCELIKALAT